MKKRNGMLLALIAICISTTVSASANPFYDSEVAGAQQNGTLFTKDQACSKNDTNGYLKVTWPGASAYNFGYNKFKRNGEPVLVYTVVVTSSGSEVQNNQLEYYLYSYNCNTKSTNEITQITTTISTNGFYYPVYVNQYYLISNIILNETCIGGCGGGFKKYLIVNQSPEGSWSQKTLDLNDTTSIKGYGRGLDWYVSLISDELQNYKNATFVEGYFSKPTGLINGSVKTWDQLVSDGNLSNSFSARIKTIKGEPYLILSYTNEIVNANNNITISLPDAFTPLSIPYGYAPQTVPPTSDSLYATITSKEVERLHQQGLTKYSLLHEFGPMNYFTREQASKFFAQFAINVLEKTPDTNVSCDFSDIDSADQTLIQNIVSACQLGLFKGFQGKFDPKRNISHEEAITVLVRLLDGKQDETMKPWYAKYLQIGSDKGYIVNDGIGFDIGTPIERGEIGQMLYKAGNK